jgi:hypothetical protein
MRKQRYLHRTRSHARAENPAAIERPVLPEIVQLVGVSRPPRLLLMPPPVPSAADAELPEMVQSWTVSTPELRMPPPLPGDFPFVIVKPVWWR